jgi:hypothetical protein
VDNRLVRRPGALDECIGSTLRSGLAVIPADGSGLRTLLRRIYIATVLGCLVSSSGATTGTAVARRSGATRGHVVTELRELAALGLVAVDARGSITVGTGGDPR